MKTDRRRILELLGQGAVLAAAPKLLVAGQTGAPQGVHTPAFPLPGMFNVRSFGAAGDGKTEDTPTINKAIDTAAVAGGGTVFFPSGTYLSYSIQLKSKVSLYLDQGATILAASVPVDGTGSGGYDPAEPQGDFEPYQDYGHNHWHNSLIWGEGIHDISIFGPGLIWGKGLSRGVNSDKDVAKTTSPGAGNKAIALKNCYNVILKDFSILQGGWFGILATGVDNLTIENLKIDTNRDGMDIDCCRNVRVSNCTVNSPWDDGICPKSSYALGYARPTENLTITNCFVTGDYQLGSVLDGTWKPMPPEFKYHSTGRIKCGTESNGGFINVTISNCVFNHCRGFALETVDGARCEDMTFMGITMRDIRNSPMFLRLGTRMRGPKDAKPGTLKRVILSNITCHDALLLPSIISGVPDLNIEDIQVNNVYLHQIGGGSSEIADRMPPEGADKYPEPRMFGDLPATGFFIRHVRNLEMSNVEIACETPDARPAFWLQDVQGADFFRLRVPGNRRSFALKSVKNFRTFGSQFLPDVSEAQVASRNL